MDEIKILMSTVSQLLRDGFDDTARRTLSDGVSMTIGRPFRPDGRFKFLVHYTSVENLFSMLTYLTGLGDQSPVSAKNECPPADSGFLRMYDTFHSNDPNEGRFFASSATRHHAFQTNHKDLWDLMCSRSQLPAYVASFRGVSTLDEVDNLVYWRTYGREGAGCAIVLPVSFIPPETSLHQVQYGQSAVYSTLDHLCNVFDELASFRALYNRVLPNTSVKIPEYVVSALSPIIYLHKADDYSFEQEVRIVVTSGEVDPDSLFYDRIQGSEAPNRIRHFACLDALGVRNLLRTDSLIMLGPSVRSRANLKYVIGRRLNGLGLYGSIVSASRIAYQP